MRSHISKSFSTVLLSGIALLTACSPESKLEKGLNTLSTQFETANQAASIEPMLALYHLEGCDDRTISMLRGALHFELGLPIKEISFEPLSNAPEEIIDFTRNGIAYGPTLEPRYRMQVSYTSEDRFTSLFTIGQNQKSEWKIICARPKPPLDY